MRHTSHILDFMLNICLFCHRHTGNIYYSLGFVYELSASWARLLEEGFRCSVFLAHYGSNSYSGTGKTIALISGSENIYVVLLTKNSCLKDILFILSFNRRWVCTAAEFYSQHSCWVIVQTEPAVEFYSQQNYSYKQFCYNLAENRKRVTLPTEMTL